MAKDLNQFLPKGDNYGEDLQWNANLAVSNQSNTGSSQYVGINTNGNSRLLADRKSTTYNASSNFSEVLVSGEGGYLYSAGSTMYPVAHNGYFQVYIDDIKVIDKRVLNSYDVMVAPSLMYTSNKFYPLIPVSSLVGMIPTSYKEEDKKRVRLMSPMFGVRFENKVEIKWVSTGSPSVNNVIRANWLTDSELT